MCYTLKENNVVLQKSWDDVTCHESTVGQWRASTGSTLSSGPHTTCWDIHARGGYMCSLIGYTCTLRECTCTVASAHVLAVSACALKPIHMFYRRACNAAGTIVFLNVTDVDLLFKDCVCTLCKYIWMSGMNIYIQDTFMLSEIAIEP